MAKYIYPIRKIQMKPASAIEHRKTCTHECAGCPFVLDINAAGSYPANSALCMATGEVVGWQAWDGSCYETYREYFNGLYACDDCGELTPGSGEEFLILCSECRRCELLIS